MITIAAMAPTTPNENAVQKIGVLTGGGDAPGLNAVIRAVVKSATNHGIEVFGVEDSFNGFLAPRRVRRLEPRDVTGILRQGGTILGTTNRGDPFRFPTADGLADVSGAVLAACRDLALDALVIIGGDGTLAIAQRFSERGLAVVGVPKTIDNDIVGTVHCFGFDTAVAFATDAVDRLHTTAESHGRVIAVEVMGRYAGWIALHAGLAGGADVILLPEIPYDLECVARHLRRREAWGARSSIVVVAEGARPRDGAVTRRDGAAGGMERLGGVCALVADHLAELTGKETRFAVLGHLQRGGQPSAFDRQLATRFGAHAVELVRQGRFGRMVASLPPGVGDVALAEVVGRTKTVPLDGDVVRAARALGISFGDVDDFQDFRG
jgi:phosphofructokinase-like protein